jgi:hypothetical protein
MGDVIKKLQFMFTKLIVYMCPDLRMINNIFLPIHLWVIQCAMENLKCMVNTSKMSLMSLREEHKIQKKGQHVGMCDLKILPHSKIGETIITHHVH